MYIFHLGIGQKLGLIHKTQEIYLARGEDKRQVEILLPVSHTLDEFKVPFNNIKSYFVKIRDIPGLASTTDHYKTVGYLLKQIENDINVLDVSLGVLCSYRDLNNEETLSGKCEITWKNYKPSYLEEYSKILQTLTTGISATSDAAYFTTNQDKLKDIKALLEQMALLVGQANKAIFDRVKIMDLLSNKKMDAEVLVGIQQKDCTLKGELENSEILSCKKTKDGLLCILEISVLTNQEKVDVYSLINYEGVQLKFEEGNYLVKHGLNWYGLKCEKDLNEHLDSFDICQQTKLDSDCINAYLDNCLFEKTEPTLSQITMEGILVQGKDLEVQLLDSLTDHRPDKISKAPPMIIVTNKIVRILKNEFEKTIHPKAQVLTEKIIDSWLTDDDISSLKNKIAIKEILDFGHYESIVGYSKGKETSLSN
jgi:hypothetical protein